MLVNGEITLKGEMVMDTEQRDIYIFIALSCNLTAGTEETREKVAIIGVLDKIRGRNSMYMKQEWYPTPN